MLTPILTAGDKARKVAEKLRGLEGSWRSQKERELWLLDKNDSNSAGPAWDASLGTIGAGNHFAELQVVEETSETDQGLRQGDVILLVHSGSRGYGGDILKRHTQQSRDSIKESDAQSYLEEHDRACKWASRNRDLIALRFLAVLEPGDPSWSLGTNEMGYQNLQVQIPAALEAISGRKVVDIWHNNIERTLWPPQSLTPSHEQGSQEPAFVHRKGAAPTLDPHTGQPLSILPLPGSRATPTLILHPTFTEANEFGKTNGLSLAHGAGRARSRADAAKYVAEKYQNRPDDLIRGDFVRADRLGNKKREQNGRDIHGGTWVVCEDKQLIWEEAGEAYKDVWDVGDDLSSHSCADIWGWCRGRISYKVRKE